MQHDCETKRRNKSAGENEVCLDYLSSTINNYAVDERHEFDNVSVRKKQTIQSDN